MADKNQIPNSLQLTQFTMDRVADAIFWVGPDAGILHVNNAACQLLGYSRDKLVGLSVLDIDANLSTEIWQNQWKSLKKAGSLTFESSVQTLDGHAIPVEITANYIKFENQEYNCAFVRDITKRKQAEQNIRDIAYFDALTGLPNRPLLHDRLEQLLAWAARDQKPLSVLSLGLDRFKEINDSMGHAISDKLLQNVANRLKICIRDGDTVSRISGDEFIVLLRDTHIEGAIRVAQIILNSLKVAYDIDGIEISTHASIGISVFPDHAQDVDKLIKHANTAMRRAREKGYDNFQLSTEVKNVKL